MVSDRRRFCALTSGNMSSSSVVRSICSGSSGRKSGVLRLALEGPGRGMDSGEEDMSITSSDMLASIRSWRDSVRSTARQQDASHPYLAESVWKCTCRCGWPPVWRGAMATVVHSFRCRKCDSREDAGGRCLSTVVQTLKEDYVGV